MPTVMPITHSPGGAAVDHSSLLQQLPRVSSQGRPAAVPLLQHVLPPAGVARGGQVTSARWMGSKHMLCLTWACTTPRSMHIPVSPAS